MFMKMTGKILDVILAVKYYNMHLHYDSCLRGLNNHEGLETKGLDYYKSLPLPNGMKNNREHYEKVLRIIADTKFLNALCECEDSELSNFDF